MTSGPRFQNIQASILYHACKHQSLTSTSKQTIVRSLKIQLEIPYCHQNSDPHNSYAHVVLTTPLPSCCLSSLTQEDGLSTLTLLQYFGNLNFPLELNSVFISSLLFLSFISAFLFLFLPTQPLLFLSTI